MVPKNNTKDKKPGLSLGAKILIGLIVGLVIGFISPRLTEFILPLGDIFLRLLKMLIVPLVFFSITSGVTKMGDIHNLRTVGLRYVAWIAIIAVVATIIGVVMGLIIQPGAGITDYLVDITEAVDTVQYNFIDNVVSWFPENIVQSMFNGDMLQIILFSLFLGVAMLSLGDTVKPLINIFDSGANIMLKITDYVMRFSPLGIMALMANMVNTLSGAMVGEIVQFIIGDWIGALILLFIIYPLIIKLWAKLPPFRYYKIISPTIIVAATTTSSAATLPVSMRLSNEKLGIPENIYGFTLPLGNTMGMSGFALYIGLMCIFASNLFGFDITIWKIIEFTFLGLMLSIGAAGVKGAGIVMSTVLFESLGMPLTLVPILAAVWPIIDIPHTVLNNVGDLIGTTIVARNLDKMDMDVYEEAKVK